MTNKELLTDANNLYSAYLKSKSGSSWKSQVQHTENNYLLEIARLQDELENETYKTGHGQAFKISERGKTRVIRSNTFRDRIVRRALCDNVLSPTLEKYLIHDNGASQTDKGISFTRKRFEQHVHRYYRKHGTNKGYILLIDFSKYYDNIRHDRLMEELQKHITDEYTRNMLKEIMSAFEIDVSFLNDEQYQNCLDWCFNAEKYYKLSPSLLTGQKMMAKSLAIGDQVSQISSVYFTTRIDNYIKVVKGVKLYGRYMDDSYIISDSKDELWSLLADIRKIAGELGIFINEKKTHIARLDKGFTWLQYRYRLTDTGHLVRKINPKRVVAERRKLKKLAKKLGQGLVEYADIERQYKSWIKSYKKVLSRRTRDNLDKLYFELYGRRAK